MTYKTADEIHRTLTALEKYLKAHPSREIGKALDSLTITGEEIKDLTYEKMCRRINRELG